MQNTIPANEADRLHNLRSYRILDTLPEDDYDDLTRLAAQICGTKVSLVSLIDKDRQWFKAQTGWDIGKQQTTRDIAFCNHTITQTEGPLVVNDARRDDRFAENPLVTGDPEIVFYAGMPLVTREGYALGSLCVIDHEPKHLDAGQLQALERLARQVVRLFELHRSVQDGQQLLRERQSAYEVLRDFSHVVAHDLKAPVRNIRLASELLRDDYAGKLPPDGMELIGMIEDRARDASRMIEGVLEYSKASHTLEITKEWLKIQDVVEQAKRQVQLHDACSVVYTGEEQEVMSSPIALLQILQNLIGNALKFNDKSVCEVRISSAREAGEGHVFYVEDNGPGIPRHHQTAIFRLFHTAAAGSSLAGGHGVGLSIVKRLVEALGGRITVSSEPGARTVFRFNLPDGK